MVLNNNCKEQKGIRFAGDNRNNAVIPLSGCLGYFTEKVLIIISGIMLLSGCLSYFTEKVLIIISGIMLLSGCLSYFTENAFIFRILIFMSDCLGYFYIIISFILFPHLY